jgi:hypothetical protein
MEVCTFSGPRIVVGSSNSHQHFVITKLREMGISLRVLMKLIGHYSLTVIQKCIESNPKLVRSAAELLG